jgi:hypothetical protein
MHVTNRDLAALKRYQKYQHKVPTFMDLLKYTRIRSWALVAVYIAFLVLVAIYVASAWYAWLLLGFMGGILYMRLKWTWRSIDSWYLTRQIIDWKRVEEMICENDERIA